jgi:hypothetical protein
MSTETSPAKRLRQRGSSSATVRVLRYAGVAALLVSAVVHGVLAPSYGASQPGLNLGKQFVVQAILTAALAVWLLLRDTPLVWLVGALVMAGTAGALILAHGPGIPQMGPMPGLREQIWDGPQLVTLVAEILFVLLAVTRALIGWRRR